MTQLTKRYAAALYGSAKAHEDTEKVLHDLETVSYVFNESQDLRTLINDPGYEDEQRRKVLEALFKDKTEPETMQFLMLLLKEKRLAYLNNIKADYTSFYNEDHNILEMTVITAADASPEMMKLITDKFSRKYNAAETVVTAEADPSLIGGAVVIVGDTRYDGSVKARIRKLKSVMEEESV